jgi:non-heme chloroperoxidase
MSSGEVVRYIARHGSKCGVKAVLIGTVPHIMVKSDKNPNGNTIDGFAEIRAGVASNRSQFCKDLAVPYFGLNRPSVRTPQGTVFQRSLKSGFCVFRPIRTL